MSANDVLFYKGYPGNNSVHETSSGLILNYCSSDLYPSYIQLKKLDFVILSSDSFWQEDVNS